MLIEIYEGLDVTELLGIQKYEPPVPAQIQGDVKGGFNWPISKTDEVRVQNNDEYRFIEALTGKDYYITLKLDGTSSTFLIDINGEFHVCGRNYSYKDKTNHAFWQIENKYSIGDKLRTLYESGKHLAIQGEYCGPGVQANRLGLTEPELFIFNVVEVPTNKRLPIHEATEIVKDMGLKFVPILEWGDEFSETVESCLEKAKGLYSEHFPTAKPNQYREGIVIRSTDNTISFKAINNDFLLKGGD